VSLMKTKRTTGGVAEIGERAKSAAAQAVPIGKRAGTTAAQGARQGVQGAREWAAPRLEDATDVVATAGTTAVQGVRQGVQNAKEWAAPRLEDAVQGAREWAAPRLEDVAEAVTASVAPKVSSALRSTAAQVRPEKSGKTGIRKLLDWRWLLGVGAVLAAAGATTAITMKRRYASATAEAKDATEASEGGHPAEATDAATTHADVNGQVTTSGKHE
jgi:hypothetical protein